MALPGKPRKRPGRQSTARDGAGAVPAFLPCPCFGKNTQRPAPAPMPEPVPRRQAARGSSGSQRTLFQTGKAALGARAARFVDGGKRLFLRHAAEILGGGRLLVLGHVELERGGELAASKSASPRFRMVLITSAAHTAHARRMSHGIKSRDAEVSASEIRHQSAERRLWARGYHWKIFGRTSACPPSLPIGTAPAISRFR